MFTRIRTAVHLHRAKRRTRQVFRREPQTSALVAVILAVMIAAVVYFFSASPALPQATLDAVEESAAEDGEPPSATMMPAVAEEMAADAAQANDTEKGSLGRTYPIDTIIPGNVTIATLFGDERFDAMLPSACSAPIKDAKRDVENVYAYNLKAQEEFEAAEQEYLRQKEKVDKAYAKLVEKRRKLDAIRIGCIEEQSPFGEAFEAYLDWVKE